MKSINERGDLFALGLVGALAAAGSLRRRGGFAKAPTRDQLVSELAQHYNMPQAQVRALITENALTTDELHETLQAARQVGPYPPVI
jgi:hypothetical protein